MSDKKIPNNIYLNLSLLYSIIFYLKIIKILSIKLL